LLLALFAVKPRLEVELRYRHLKNQQVAGWAFTVTNKSRVTEQAGEGRASGPSQIATWARENRLVRIMRYFMRRGLARSGEADVQDKVPEPQVEYCAVGPVHDERQKDDGQDYDDHPEEEHDDAGDGIPGYSSRSSHGHQLPTAARLIRQVLVRPLIGYLRSTPNRAAMLLRAGSSADGVTVGGGHLDLVTQAGHLAPLVEAFLGAENQSANRTGAHCAGR
jgi:hypothetical protein